MALQCSLWQTCFVFITELVAVQGKHCIAFEIMYMILYCILFAVYFAVIVGQVLHLSSFGDKKLLTGV